MTDFKDWVDIQEACIGFAIADLNELLYKYGLNLFEANLFGGDDMWVQKAKPQAPKSPEERMASGEISGPSTHLPQKQIKSAYDEHTAAIRAFASRGPDEFAQVILFSPLSAHAQFQRHWDNFQTLMMVLKHHFPQDGNIDPREIEHVLDSFSDKYYTMGATIANFGGGGKKKIIRPGEEKQEEKPKIKENVVGKFDTIAYVWGNRKALKDKLESLAAQSKWGEIMEILVKIPGIAPIKAGFAVQMLFGHLGCLDVHNIDIYKRAFPDIMGQGDSKEIMDKWGVSKKNGEITKKGLSVIKDYMKTLEQLDKHGIGTKQLWDVWTEFMQNFYKMTSGTGYGVYADTGRSLDPDEPVYKDLRQRAGEIPKERVAQVGGGKANIPVATGQGGRGPSATHLQDDPENTLLKFHKIYNMGEPGDEQSSAIPFYSKGDKPAYPDSGLGPKPGLLHYFGPAIGKKPGGGFEVDRDWIRNFIRQKSEKGGGPKDVKKQRERIYGKPAKQTWMF